MPPQPFLAAPLYVAAAITGQDSDTQSRCVGSWCCIVGATQRASALDWYRLQRSQGTGKKSSSWRCASEKDVCREAHWRQGSTSRLWYNNRWGFACRQIQASVESAWPRCMSCWKTWLIYMRRKKRKRMWKDFRYWWVGFMPSTIPRSFSGSGSLVSGQGARPKRAPSFIIQGGSYQLCNWRTHTTCGEFE